MDRPENYDRFRPALVTLVRECVRPYSIFIGGDLTPSTSRLEMLKDMEGYTEAVSFFLEEELPDFVSGFIPQPLVIEPPSETVVADQVTDPAPPTP